LHHAGLPDSRFLKQPLKHSRSGLVLFHAVSGVLRPRGKFPLSDLASIFFEHFNAGMASDGFHHLVVAPS